MEHTRLELVTPTLPVLCAPNCANAPASKRAVSLAPAMPASLWDIEPRQADEAFPVITLERAVSLAPSGTRTLDPLIKSQLLYQLS